MLLLSEGEGSGGSEESESEEEVVEEGVTVKRKKKHRRKSELKTGFFFKGCMFGYSGSAYKSVEKRTQDANILGNKPLDHCLKHWCTKS